MGRRPLLGVGALWSVCLLSMLTVIRVEGIVYEFSATLNDEDPAVMVQQPFGMSANGIIDVSVTVTNYDETSGVSNPLVFAVLNEVQRLNMPRPLTGLSKTQACFTPAQFRTEFFHELTVSSRVEVDDLFSLWIFNCNDELTVEVSGAVSLVNDGDIHVSLSQLPLGPMYSVVSVVYVVGILLWICVGKGKTHLPNGRVFKILTVIFAIKAIHVFWATFYYLALPNAVHGLDWANVVRQLLATSTETAFLFMMVLLSGLFPHRMDLRVGLTTTRNKLSEEEYRFYRDFFLVFLVAKYLVVACTADSGLCEAYALLLDFILPFLMLFFAITSTYANIGALQSIVFDPGWTVQQQAMINIKLEVYNIFQVAGLIYISLPIVRVGIELFLLSWQQRGWVPNGVEEVFLLSIYVLVAWLYRPRRLVEYHEYLRMFERTDNVGAPRADDPLPTQYDSGPPGALGAPPQNSNRTLAEQIAAWTLEEMGNRGVRGGPGVSDSDDEEEDDEDDDEYDDDNDNDNERRREDSDSDSDGEVSMPRRRGGSGDEVSGLRRRAGAGGDLAPEATALLSRSDSAISSPASTPGGARVGGGVENLTGADLGYPGAEVIDLGEIPE